MLELRYFRQDTETTQAGLQKRGLANAAELMAQVNTADERRRQTQKQQDELLSQSKQLAKQIGGLMKEGNRTEADQVKLKTTQLKADIQQLGEQLKTTEEELKELLLALPNLPREDVPPGHSEADNVVVREGGTKPQLHEGAKPHWELIADYDLIDFELGTKITGAGFPVYKGAAAKLNRALATFFLQRAEEAGYHEVQPPIVVNEASGLGTGQLPDKEGQMYEVPSEGLYLIPTAEVPVTNLYRDSLLKEEQLPVKNVAYTPCFRREAGSWGANVRGLNRLHQFDKVEIVQLAKPEDSDAILEEMVAHVESLVQALELPYRILKLCAGDLGFTSAITYDFEVWSGAQQRWLEVSSVSNFRTYQSNRLSCRYKDTEGKNQLVHTLNGSALALPRIVACLLENNQRPEGIAIPEVLQGFMGTELIGRG